eukprot:TRINITY_DN107032_c0_g1_i1.p1 TRINITY_DN107032_c0_g1~~TRINITY_DN107032_c0_g1_i1.p1  ORF type:complete len:119 (-),score=11.23 TRINITY_DN107032_c0_g1_i1:68-424(-)
MKFEPNVHQGEDMPTYMNGKCTTIILLGHILNVGRLHIRKKHNSTATTTVGVGTVLNVAFAHIGDGTHQDYDVFVFTKNLMQVTLSAVVECETAVGEPPVAFCYMVVYISQPVFTVQF